MYAADPARRATVKAIQPVWLSIATTPKVVRGVGQRLDARAFWQFVYVHGTVLVQAYFGRAIFGWLCLMAVGDTLASGVAGGVMGAKACAWTTAILFAVVQSSVLLGRLGQHAPKAVVQGALLWVEVTCDSLSVPESGKFIIPR